MQRIEPAGGDLLFKACLVGKALDQRGAAEANFARHIGESKALCPVAQHDPAGGIEDLGIGNKLRAGHEANT